MTLKGKCQLGRLCAGSTPLRVGLLTLLKDRWEPPITTTDDRRDAILVCDACADWWCKWNPGKAVLRKV